MFYFFLFLHFLYSRDFASLTVYRHLRIQGILPLLLFLDTLGIREPQMTSDGKPWQEEVTECGMCVETGKQQNPLLVQKPDLRRPLHNALSP